MRRIKKTVFVSLVSIIIVLIALSILLSPLTKYLIEKWDKKYTGREITLDKAYVNPFTGLLSFDNLQINELESHASFLSVKRLTINVSMFKLFSKNYEISELILDHPVGWVIQNKNIFNFSDLIVKFFSKKNHSTPKKKEIHLSILNIKIKNGTFYYKDIVTPINYFIKKVDLESEGYRWNSDTIPIKFSLHSGIGSGEINGDLTVNSKNKNYRLSVIVKQYNMNIIGQYLKDLSNYGSFRATLDANFHSNGNFAQREKVTNSGLLQISDFHFGKNEKEDYLSFEKLAIAIHEISPSKFVYYYDSLSLTQPYFKYEKYDHLDNVQTIFGRKGANVKIANSNKAKFNLVIELAKYLKTISKNLLRSDYRADRIAIYDGQIKYNDYSLSEKFSAGLSSFYFEADSVSKIHDRVHLRLTSAVKPFGNLALKISINPKDSSDFDLSYYFKKLPISMFNPFLIKYTSFPLDRGSIEVKGLWNVRNGQINSRNHILVIDPRLAEKINNKDARWLPMHFAMFLAREKGNVIDYEIPIKGDLKNPKFKLKDVLTDALKNILVKPVTSSYRIEVKNAETEIEKSLSLKWEMRSSTVNSKQKRFLEKLAEFLSENPSTTIVLNPQWYDLKEKEYILFYEAKKSYFCASNGKSIRSVDYGDSVEIEKMSIKDSAFIRYLNKNNRDPLLFTVQEKCYNIISRDVIHAKFKALKKERFNMFMSFFKENGTSNRVEFKAGVNLTPYNGFSFYKIEYQGDYPDYLLKAY